MGEGCSSTKSLGAHPAQPGPLQGMRTWNYPPLSTVLSLIYKIAGMQDRPEHSIILSWTIFNPTTVIRLNNCLEGLRMAGVEPPVGLYRRKGGLFFFFFSYTGFAQTNSAILKDSIVSRSFSYSTASSFLQGFLKRSCKFDRKDSLQEDFQIPKRREPAVSFGNYFPLVLKLVSSCFSENFSWCLSSPEVNGLVNFQFQPP